MSWLYDHIDQLDGYRLYAEIAHRFRRQVLPEDRDDIEIEIVLGIANCRIPADTIRNSHPQLLTIGSGCAIIFGNGMVAFEHDS